MTSVTYRVTGMTCEHCVRAVSGELRALDGVSDVAVDLVLGGASAVTVTGDGPLAWRAVADALDEAGGYRLALHDQTPGRPCRVARSSLGPECV
jgi:copper chaperone